MPARKLPKGKGFIHKFDWGLYPEGEDILQRFLVDFLKKHSVTRGLSQRMKKETSTRFFDWVDHIIVPDTKATTKSLTRAGFKKKKHRFLPSGATLYEHPTSIFFPVLLHEKTNEVILKPERLDDCVAKLGSETDIEGEPFDLYRKAILSTKNNYLLSAVERRGFSGFTFPQTPSDTYSYEKIFQEFLHRERRFSGDVEGMKQTKTLIRNALKKLDKNRAADAFFRAERAYWESKNRAGQIQKARQDVLGLGWGNHDHHTYRSSRKHFKDLISLFETFGYKLREQFYAGEEAGWGAQVLEHDECDIVIFADVDLDPHETKHNFAHKGLRQRTQLGTVGLWVGLHGESILQSGLHHLEARFDFKKLCSDLPKDNIRVMSPFSNFAFLKQAFTEGEHWPVAKARAQKLLANKSITQEHYDTFVKSGAIGSHLENLERNQGYKGFNQHSVSVILQATDPRKHKIRGA